MTSPFPTLRALSIFRVEQSLNVIFVQSVVLAIQGWWEGLVFILNSVMEGWLRFGCISKSLLIHIREK